MYGRHYRHSLLGMTALLAGAPAGAQDDATGNDEQMTVFGTRLPSPGPQRAETLTSAEIDALFATTVVDLLRQLPGVTSIQPGGAGGFPEVYIRGADPNFSVVFVDGVRMNDPTDARGGAFDFSGTAPGEVERIEVVRGPFSALYGSGALAGAINIDTRRGAEAAGADARLVVGSDGYREIGARLGGSLAAGRAGLNVNYVDFGEPTPHSSRTVASLAAHYDLELSEGLSGTASLRTSSRERTSYPVASGGPRFAAADALESAEADDSSFGASLRWGGAAQSFTARMSVLQRTEVIGSPAIPDGVYSGAPSSVSETDFDRYSFLLESRSDLGNVQVGAGVEYQYEEGSTAGKLELGDFVAPTSFSVDRRTVSPFVEFRADLGRGTTVFSGLRFDDFSDLEDDALSPRVGVAWQHGEDGLTVTAAWGEARKSPSFYALGDPLVGNPDLEAEDSDGVDLSTTLPLGRGVLSLTLSAYRYRYANLIDFDFGAFELVNRSEVDTRGLELALDGTLTESVKWSAFAAVHENEVDGIDDALLHRPEFSAGAAVLWSPNERATLSASLQHEGERPSSSIPRGAETLQPYSRVDASLVLRLTPSLDLRVGIANLFAAEYEVVVGTPAPERQVRVGFRQSFWRRAD